MSEATQPEVPVQAPQAMKPYDFKVLMERLKAKGLDIAEDAVVMIWNETSAWVKESAQVSVSKMDDLAIPVIEIVDGFAKVQIDKIDGKVG